MGWSRGSAPGSWLLVALAVALALTGAALAGWRSAPVPVAGAAGPAGVARLAAVAQDEAGTPSPGPAAGQAAGPLRETLIQAVLEELPPPPAFVRLVRFTLQPGASVPLHTRPGFEFGWVESGAVTVRVEGEVVVAPAAAGGEAQQALVPPVGEAFELGPGDQIVYPAGVPFAFANEGEVPANILTVLILPVGEGSPPSFAWVDGTPEAAGLEGIDSRILGDGIVPEWPRPPLGVVVDRVVLGSGATVPARPGPVLLSVVDGRFEFQLLEGQFQVSSGDSGPQLNATPGAAYSLGPGDAVFFPGGMTDVPRPAEAGILVLLRLSVLSVPGAAAGTPTAGTDNAAGTPAATAEAPAPTEPVSTEPVPAETAAAEDGAAAGGLAPGTAVVVTESGVRLRDAPSTAAGVVAELDEGSALAIAGPPVEGDGIVWYPVQVAADPAVTGFIAEAFIAAA